MLYCDLCCFEDAVVPSCIRFEEHLQLIDAGVMLNMPFPPFLGEKRDVDLLIALDYGADDAFKVRHVSEESLCVADISVELQERLISLADVLKMIK